VWGSQRHLCGGPQRPNQQVSVVDLSFPYEAYFFFRFFKEFLTTRGVQQGGPTLLLKTQQEGKRQKVPISSIVASLLLCVAAPTVSGQNMIGACPIIQSPTCKWHQQIVEGGRKIVL